MSGIDRRKRKVARHIMHSGAPCTWGFERPTKAELRRQLAEAVANTPGARPVKTEKPDDRMPGAKP